MNPIIHVLTMLNKNKTPYVILSTLLVLFCLRVLGQMAVEFNFCVAGFSFSSILPPLKEWQSGLLPYPLLMFFQITIIGIFARVCFDFKRESGWFFDAKEKLGTPLLNFAKLYILGNSIRLLAWITIFQEHHMWYSGFIPIAFHYVLAEFLFIVAKHHQQRLLQKQIQFRLPQNFLPSNPFVMPDRGV